MDSNKTNSNTQREIIAAKIHTTPMGSDRIRKNLNLDTDDVVSVCRNLISDRECNLQRRGKNWYCTNKNTVITVNASSYTIITAHIVK